MSISGHSHVPDALSSVARGGGGGATAPSLAWNECKIARFWCFWGRFLLQKWKQPPHGIRVSICKGLAVISTRKVEFFLVERTPSWSGEETEFWWRPFFFFWDHLNTAGKTVSIFVKTFFFGVHLILTEKPHQSDSRQMKIWFKLVYRCFYLSKKPPPFAKSWLCAWMH